MNISATTEGGLERLKAGVEAVDAKASAHTAEFELLKGVREAAPLGSFVLFLAGASGFDAATIGVHALVCGVVAAVARIRRASPRVVAAAFLALCCWTAVLVPLAADSISPSVLARAAAADGDPVASEAYYPHADHYYRLMRQAAEA